MNSAPREVTDADAIKWSCIEATAGVAVVCTPSGGARSVRLEALSSEWRRLPDAKLLEAIAQARNEQ